MANLPSGLRTKLITMYGLLTAFHGMRIIAVGTRTQKQEPSESVHILRLRFLLKARNITVLQNFPIKGYEPDELCSLSKITLKPVMELI